MSVPSNLVPTRISELTEYAGSSTEGYIPYVAGGVTYKITLSSLVGLSVTGVQTIPVSAIAMYPRTTSGCAFVATSESTTNKVITHSMAFDASTQEYAQFSMPMPKSWDEGTVSVQFIWTAAATGNVVWGAQGVAISDDDPLDSAFGTAMEVTDGVTAAGDLMESAFTNSITIGGTPASEDWVVFQVYRKAADAADTLAVDASLIGLRIKYTASLDDDS